MRKLIVLGTTFLLATVALVVVAISGELTGGAAAQGSVPPVTNIAVCSGPSAGEVIISWDSVPGSSYYRIGYVNMVKDYPRAKASATGEWIEAFVYVDVNARNIPVSGGRGQYTLRRLVPGDRHAFTVLTSNNVVNTVETISGAYSWPQNPRWAFHTVANPQPDCTAASPPVVITPTPTAAAVTPTPTIPPQQTATPTPAASVGSEQSDRAALVALYNATDGPSWRHNTNWLSDVPLDEWDGVVTDDEGRVIRLDLGRNRLMGQIPPELGDLSNLENLYLSSNDLTEIPTQLGNLSNLENLYLSSNDLTEIPPELGNLSNLENLYLRDNQLTGRIPPQLGNLSNLENLDLSSNDLTEIPPELGDLSNLENLDLSSNDLTRIPTQLGDLANLENLYLASNDLTRIPTQLGDLANLENLYLHDNQLTGRIPTQLGDLSNLENLDLSSNDLTKPEPR